MASEKPAHEVFSLLADETRVAILEAVARAQREREGANAGPATLRFSDLYDRIDVDGTSKLSYHLGELTGTFLRKTEAGYSFTHAGERMVRFVLSGNYGPAPAVDPVDVVGTCLHCGDDTLEATFDEQFFVVRCRDCERPVTAYHVSPAQVRDADGNELVRRIVRRQTAELEMARRGVCPECAGPLTSSISPVPEGVDLAGVDYLARDHCGACMRRLSNPLPVALAYHPASVAFHWDAGVDVTETGVWELLDHLREGRWTAVSIEGETTTYEVLYRRGDDALRFRLAEDGSVVRTERVRGRDVSMDES